MIKVQPFTSYHLLDIEPSSFYDDDPTVCERMVGAENNENGRVRTIFKDDKIIAIIGLVELWPGLIEIWAIISKYASRYWLSFSKAMRKMLDFWVDEMKAHRTQMLIREKFSDKLVRWAEFLGFEFEAELKRFGPTGENYLLFARF